MTYNYPEQPPRKSGMSAGAKIAVFGCALPAALGLLLIGGCAVVGDAVINEDIKEDKRAAKEDVKLLSCKITKEEFIGPNIESQVKITNNGKKRADYLVKGEYIDGKGNKVGELLATIDSLAPGTSTTQDFSGLFTSSQLEGVTKGECKILEVTRNEWSAANG